MSIILAIEPDRRQRHALGAVVRQRVGAELILADTTERALEAIGNRVPDLVLVPALLSPQDDAALAAALRVIAAAAHVRTLTIPVLATETASEPRAGLLSRWRRGRDESQAPDGCDPAVFADQVKAYLAEAAAERADRQQHDDYSDAPFDNVRPIAAAAPADFQDEMLVASESPVFETPWRDEPVQMPAAVVSAFEPIATESAAFEPVAFEPFAADRIEVPRSDPFAVRPRYVEPPPQVAAISDEHDREAARQHIDRSADAADRVVEIEFDRFAERVVDDTPIAAPEPFAAAPSRFVDPPKVHARTTPPKRVVDEPVEDEPAVYEPLVAAAFEPRVADSRPGGELLDERIAEEFGVGGWVPEPIEEFQRAVAVLPAAATPEDAAMLAEFADASTAKAPVKEKWAAVSLARPQPWPNMDGVPIEAAGEARRAAAAPARESKERVPRPERADKPAPAATRERSEWSELVASLRQDIERRRTEPAPAPAPPKVAAAAPAAPVDEVVPEAPAAKPKPVQDEWGFFDPEQCGFAALLAKLDEITETPDERERQRR